MALSVEVAELVEIFQWMTEEQSKDFDCLDGLMDEIGDVQIYLTMIADNFGLDPIEMAKRKFKKNEKKHPTYI